MACESYPPSARHWHVGTLGRVLWHLLLTLPLQSVQQWQHRGRLRTSLIDKPMPVAARVLFSAVQRRHPQRHCIKTAHTWFLHFHLVSLLFCLLFKPPFHFHGWVRENFGCISRLPGRMYPSPSVRHSGSCSTYLPCRHCTAGFRIHMCISRYSCWLCAESMVCFNS